MVIAIGALTLSSGYLKCQGLVAPAEAMTEYYFVGGGYEANFNTMTGKNFSFQATLAADTRGDVLQGSYTWADILAMRTLPNYPQVIQHPKITELGLDGITAVVHKVDLDALTQYNGKRGEYIDQTATSMYPGTTDLLRWYGTINFTITS